MKKTLFFAAAVLFLGVNSQAQSPKIKLGFHAGASMANMKFEDDGMTISPKSSIGLQGGIVTDLQLSKHISIQPGINFVQKGFKLNDPDSYGSDDKYTERLNTIEIPVNLLFNSNGSNGNFFVGAGPSVSFAFAGKYIDMINNETEEIKMKFGNDATEHDYRVFDFGLNGMIGYEFNGGLFVAANYNIGLRNLFPGSDSEDEKAKAHYAGFRIGYFLNR